MLLSTRCGVQQSTRLPSYRNNFIPKVSREVYRAEYCGILCQSPRREHHAMTLSKPLERRKNTIGMSSHHIETTSRGRCSRERERPFRKTEKKKSKHEAHTHAHERRTTSREFDATGNTFPCIELVAFLPANSPQQRLYSVFHASRGRYAGPNACSSLPGTLSGPIPCPPPASDVMKQTRLSGPRAMTSCRESINSRTNSGELNQK